MITEAGIKTKDSAEESNLEIEHPIINTSNRAVVSKDLDLQQCNNSQPNVSEIPLLKPVTSIDKIGSDFEIKEAPIKSKQRKVDQCDQMEEESIQTQQMKFLQTL